MNSVLQVVIALCKVIWIVKFRFGYKIQRYTNQMNSFNDISFLNLLAWGYVCVTTTKSLLLLGPALTDNEISDLPLGYELGTLMDICDNPLPQSPHLRSLFRLGLSHYGTKVLQDVSNP